jgi:hypothetical protein
MVEKEHRTRDGTLVEPGELAAKERRHGRAPVTRPIPVQPPARSPSAEQSSATPAPPPAPPEAPGDGMHVL